jgi:hypothetical protein
MTMEKRSLIAAALCLAFATVGFAQQPASNAPASRQDVEKYLDAMHMNQTMLKMAQAMAKPMHQMIHEEYVKNKEKCNLPPDFEARMDKLMDEEMKNWPWQKILEATIPIYQKYFTKSDMESLAAFYSGPVGQKMMREMPSIMADTMQVTMPFMMEHSKEMAQRIRQDVYQAEKKSQKKSCPPAPGT